MTAELAPPAGKSRMSVLLALPEGKGPHPAVVVIHHRDGLDAFTRRVVEHLAEYGFAAAAPNLFHRRTAGEDTMESRKSLTDREVAADIDATVAQLQAHPAVRGDALAIIGHCMGGRMSYLGAATNPAFKAAVVVYGGGILRAEGKDTPPPIELTANIRCPILGLFGREDTNPSPEDVQTISAALKRNGKRHDFHVYDGAGHAFQNFDSPERYRPAVSEDAWKRLLAFVSTELKAA